MVQVDDVVVAMNDELRPIATRVASRLRSQGRNVDLLLQTKKMKAVFKVCCRSSLLFWAKLASFTEA